MTIDWAKGPDPNAEKVQGSEAWKKWRSRGLGSSDAAVLLGWSPWKNIEQLFSEKMGIWKPTFSDYQRKAMARGTRLEPAIRKWYEVKEGALFSDDAMEHRDYPFMRASFDGKNNDLKRIIEIKAPNANDHMDAKHGHVSEKYIAQIQWLLLVSGFSRCDYISYGSDDTYAEVAVMADPLLQSELLLRAKVFWQHLQEKKEFPEFKKWYYPGSIMKLDLSDQS